MCRRGATAPSGAPCRLLDAAIQCQGAASSPSMPAHGEPRPPPCSLPAASGAVPRSPRPLRQPHRGERACAAGSPQAGCFPPPPPRCCCCWRWWRAPLLRPSSPPKASRRPSWSFSFRPTRTGTARRLAPSQRPTWRGATCTMKSPRQGAEWGGSFTVCTGLKVKRRPGYRVALHGRVCSMCWLCLSGRLLDHGFTAARRRVCAAAPTAPCLPLLPNPLAAESQRCHLVLSRMLPRRL